jgi:hypothetical protein
VGPTRKIDQPQHDKPPLMRRPSGFIAPLPAVEGRAAASPRSLPASHVLIGLLVETSKFLARRHKTPSRPFRKTPGWTIFSDQRKGRRCPTKYSVGSARVSSNAEAPHQRASRELLACFGTACTTYV